MPACHIRTGRLAIGQLSLCQHRLLYLSKPNVNTALDHAVVNQQKQRSNHMPM
jgi:hypothetical protein